jgi:hypothetical protein
MSGDLGRYSEQGLLEMGALAVFRKPLFTIDLAEKLMEIAREPRLNPSFAEARGQAMRRAPARQAASPAVQFVLRKIGRELPQAKRKFHGDLQLRWTGRDED